MPREAAAPAREARSLESLLRDAASGPKVPIDEIPARMGGTLIEAMPHGRQPLGRGRTLWGKLSGQNLATFSSAPNQPGPSIPADKDTEVAEVSFHVQFRV
jgi:hypothetical protein